MSYDEKVYMVEFDSGRTIHVQFFDVDEVLAVCPGLTLNSGVADWSSAARLVRRPSDPDVDVAASGCCGESSVDRSGVDKPVSIRSFHDRKTSSDIPAARFIVISAAHLSWGSCALTVSRPSWA